MKTFQDFNIDLCGKSTGSIKTICPQCSHTRKKTKDPCLSVDINKGVWNCHNCGFSGSLRDQGDSKSNGNGNGRVAHIKPVSPTVPETGELKTMLSANALKWFEGRSIPLEVLQRNKIGEGLEYMPQVEKEVNTIHFPYIKNGEVVNIQYRDGQKNFKLIKNGEMVVYGFDDIEGNGLVWVEGQLDKLAIETAGIKNCVSVPNGAKSKLNFLESMQDILDPITKFIIAVDNDSDGKKLEQELVRRLGPEKCYLVKWPEGCKDANDVLMDHGKEKLINCIERAKPFPIEGIFEISDIALDIVEYYTEGAQGGVKTQWPTMKSLYSVRGGEWTLVTGIPSHGKSEFIDALVMGLAEEHDWKFAVCSPENQPLYRHAAKLIEKYLRKPFKEGPRERLTIEELIKSFPWIEDHFSFVLPNENDMTVNGILKLAKVLVFRKGIKGLIIDPWNELDHSRPGNLSETEYISQSLSKIRS